MRWELDYVFPVINCVKNRVSCDAVWLNSKEDAPEDVPKVVKQFFELIVKQWFYIRDDDLESFKISILRSDGS